MTRAAAVAQQFRRAGVDAPPDPVPWAGRWYGKLAVLAGGAGLLTLAFAPVGWWPLAWIGLVPWLLVVGRTRGVWSAFGWSWVGGTLFFIANMWWMSAVTVPGMIGLMAILGLYWGYAGIILRAANVRSPTAGVVFTAVVWVAAAEWFRGTWPWHGLPWLYLGYTQSPFLLACQSADLFGVAGVSFVVVATNAWVARWVANRLSLRGLVPAGCVVLGLIGADVGYGIWRMRTEVLRLVPGPAVMVVQPNYPQDNSGEKGVAADQILDDHLKLTMGQLGATAGVVDLVVWSETMMPPFNKPARDYLAATGRPFTRDAFRHVQNLCYDYRVGLLTGGLSIGRFEVDQQFGEHQLDRSNVVYSFDRQGAMDDTFYRKIHLVPFGEFIPFKEGFPPLYRLAVKLGPPNMTEYELVPGTEDELTVFPLAHDPHGPDADAPPWRYATPICFEDIDPDLCAAMCRPDADAGDRKRVDFLVNVTNDGWFMANENSQHLQAAVFRSIENRVPTARSVNTGISGFVDPLGRTDGLIPARQTGTSVGRLQLDGRVTLFTRTGQLFAWCCASLTGLTAVACLARWAWRRVRRPRPAAA